MSISNTIYHRSQHLEEVDLVPTGSDVDSCKFCGGTALSDVWILQNDPLVSLKRCFNCEAVGASRMPTDAALARYYSAYYSSDSDGLKFTLGAPNRLALRIAAQFTVASGRDISILDFGGGDGTISYLLAMELLKRGGNKVSITVVDYESRTI